MDEDVAVENVKRKNEKKVKPEAKKVILSKESATGINEAKNVDKTKAIESARISEKEDNAYKKRDHKGGREKKKSSRNVEADIKKGSKEDEVTNLNGENGSGLTMHRAERRREKKKKKRDKNKNKNDEFEGNGEEIKRNESKKCLEGESVKESGEKDRERNEQKVEKNNEDGENVGGDVNAMKKPERRKNKKHKKKENYKDEGKRKKKKSKFVENGSHDGQDNENEYANGGKKRKTAIVENGSSATTPNKSNKKVRFSSEVKVFPLPGDSNTEKENDEDNLTRGKRFTREEDEIVKDAVLKYIDEYELGEEGLDMVLNCRKYPKLKGCWKEIGSAIPYRPYSAIYYRARVLFMRSETRKWTQEEYDMILKYHEQHGSKWKALADELGKHTWHVKDTYRRIKLPDLKKGNWSQEEYQRLFNLVNTDLQLKVSEEKKSKHGMLRDNICWSAISDELSTRNQAACCLKWYKQLTSSMVAEGIWADSDDYRLLSALYELDATCLEDVDWDDLVENRSGDVCRKRWDQMVLHIGQHGNKSFSEQVEVLAQRYCPHLLEVREAWDSKPRVP